MSSVFWHLAILATIVCLFLQHYWLLSLQKRIEELEKGKA